MSSVGRSVKNLEAPRPLKSTLKQSYVQPMYEVQSIEELITLTENVATTLQSGCNDAEGMNALLSNLRIHGPQLEMISKDTLDRTFVIFRNASQDERLNIMTRLNLLELIELRAKAWQITEGLNTYYKHKATNVEPEVSMNEQQQQQQQLQLQTQQSLLGTSPPAMSLGQSPTVPILAPGELLRNSGKFPKPTKIPGKNYSKDEVVIRNADSGKVMGIKGRRVHMIEELSETIISFQRVTPGAKERLVQITGPNEEKINYAKQLIEDTIRRNTSPIRLDSANQEDCCSLASSSASDDTAARVQHTSNNRNSIGASIHPSSVAAGSAAGHAMAQAQYMPNQMPPNMGGNHMQMQYPGKMTRNGGPMGGGQPPNLLLHSFSTNDASLGEYKYTVNVGQHNIKITGECFDLVRVAKLVLDDYFSSNEFLASVDLASYEQMVTSAQPQLTPLTMHQPHHLITGSPFVDSGINLDMMGQTPPISGGGGGSGKPFYGAQKSVPAHLDQDDDVFIVEEKTTLKPHNSSPSMESSSSSSSTVNAAASAPSNGLSRSRRSHFSRKDTVTESQPTKLIKDARVSYEYERLIMFSKSPHSWALPQEWLKICDRLPQLVKNKVTDTTNSSIANVSVNNNATNINDGSNKPINAHYKNTHNNNNFGHNNSNNGNINNKNNNVNNVVKFRTPKYPFNRSLSLNYKFNANHVHSNYNNHHNNNNNNNNNNVPDGKKSVVCTEPACEPAAKPKQVKMLSKSHSSASLMSAMAPKSAPKTTADESSK